MGTTQIQVQVGDTFRSVIADCNALWRVTRIDGDTAHCVVVNEPWKHNGHTYASDFAGRRQPFYVSDVASRIAQAQAWERVMQENDEFFDGLELGQVVHYHNGFGEFVRCMVVEYDYDFRTGPSEYTAGQKVLLPIALVGNWNPRDLPHEIRQADGSVYESVPYHAKKVLTMSGAWRPSAGCVFESPSFKGNPRFQEDPSTMEPLDLTMRKAGS